MEDLSNLVLNAGGDPEKIRDIIEKLSQAPELLYGNGYFSQKDLVILSIKHKLNIAYNLIDWYKYTKIFESSVIAKYLDCAIRVKNIGVLKHIMESFNLIHILSPRQYNVFMANIVDQGDLQILQLMLSFASRDDTLGTYKIDMNTIFRDVPITNVMEEKYIQIFKNLIQDKRCKNMGVLKFYVHAAIDILKDLQLANKCLSPDFEDLNIKIEETGALCRTLKYFRQKCAPMIRLTSETILYRPDSMQSRLAKLCIFILNKSGTSDWNSINQSERIILYDELKKDDKLSDYYSILTIDDMARVF